MELMKRKQSFISILDYMNDCTLINNNNILCAEVLVNKIPDNIDLKIITHKQISKYYPDLRNYIFDDLELVNLEYAFSIGEQSKIILTYITTTNDYHEHYECMRSDWY